jgi:hypothetical protein
MLSEVGLLGGKRFKGMSGPGGELLPMQSSSSTVRRSTSTFFRPSRSEFRTSSVLLREVAKMGAFVVCRRCRVRANPIPREAGETKHHAIFLWGYKMYNLAYQNSVMNNGYQGL